MRITVQVKPNARQNRVEEIAPGIFRVRVTATPEKGKANEAVLRLLAKYLRVPFSSLSLVRGSKGRKKLIEVCR